MPVFSKLRARLHLKLWQNYIGQKRSSADAVDLR